MSSFRTHVHALVLGGLGLLACASEQPSAVEAPVCPEPAATAAAPARDRVADIEALATRARELFEVPGLAVAVVHEGEVVLARGFGERAIGSGVAVDERTSFQIASNTKAFIATTVGLLVADGTLSWDDRVVEHMPGLKLWSEHVSAELRVRDLLSHRVGLDTWAGDLMWISSKIDLPTLLGRLQYLPASAGLRERYGYSNLMFVLAGELIRVKTGQPWEAVVRARLLDPLGMDAVATRAAELEGNDNLALPHIEVDGQLQTSARLDIGVTGAAGALDASVLELSKWLRMQLADGQWQGQQLVPAAVIRETRTPHINIRVRGPDTYDPPRHLRAYGLGWALEDYRGRLLVAHGGGLPGMTSRVLMVPEEQLGIVVLTNSESPTAALLALQLADLYLSDAPGKDYLGDRATRDAEREAKQAQAKEAEAKEQTTPAALPPTLPPTLEGRYANPMLGAAKILRADDALVFEAHEHGGLRCVFDPNAARVRAGAGAGAGAGELRVPCTWDDPNMGVSTFTIVTSGRRRVELRFRVRPSFYDPLEYRFERR